MSQDNLLLLVPSLKLGGQERVAVNTAQVLQDVKNVSIAVFDSRDAVYDTDAEVIDLKLPAVENRFLRVINVFRRVRALKRLKRERKIDCTLSFGDTANLANALSRRKDRVVLSVRGHSSIPKGSFGAWMWHCLYNKADLVICVAKQLSEELAYVCHLKPEKVVTVYNPYDIKKISEMREEESPIKIKKPAVVSVGRLQDVKGYRQLMRAVKLAEERIPKLNLILVGDGPIKAQLAEEAKQLGLKVQFAGFQKNPFAIVSKCSCYVLSSINEGFPNAMVEAMACGIPTVAVDCETGPREILNYKEDEEIQKMTSCEFGILCPAFTSDFSHEPQKEKILADAIVKMLSEERVRVSYRVRAELRARMFSFEQYRDRLLSVLFAKK